MRAHGSRPDDRKSLSALPYDDLLDVVVLHHEASGAVVEVDEAGGRILGRRALNDAGPRRGVEDVEIVGRLLLARGLTAVDEQIAARARLAAVYTLKVSAPSSPSTFSVLKLV